MNIARTIKNEWLQLAIFIAPFLIIPFVWGLLPERIPVHFDFHGNPNRFAPKWFGLMILPVVNLGLAALLGALSKVDPKAWLMNISPDALKPVRLIVTCFIFAIFCVTVLYTLGEHVSVEMAFQFGLPILLLLLGNYLPRIKPNYFFGVRTPWALESPDNWRLTHRFAARLWMIVSIAYIVLVIALGDRISETAFWIYLAVIIIPPFVYSWWIFEKSKKQVNE
jgi:uncharacterized membrane protein